MAALRSYSSGHDYETNTEQDIRELGEIVEHDLKATDDVLATHVGYPRNWIAHEWINNQRRKFVGKPLHNIGDHEAGSLFKPNAIPHETQVVDFFMEIFRCPGGAENFYAYCEANGSKANEKGIKWGRDSLRANNPGKKPLMIYPDCAHYSLRDGAATCDVEAVEIKSHNGVADPEAYAAAFAKYPDRTIICGILTGGTVHQGRADIPAIQQAYKDTGRPRKEIFYFIDAAFDGVSLNLLDGVPSEIVPNFLHDVDAIMTSIHKFIGTTAPLGFIIARREHTEHSSEPVEYIGSGSKAGGSRDAKSIYEAYLYIMFLKKKVLRVWAQACVDAAVRAKVQLLAAGYEENDVLLHECATTIHFPQPSQRLMDQLGLAPERGYCHLIAAPHTLPSNELGKNVFGEEFKSYDSLCKAVKLLADEKRAAVLRN